MRMYSQGGIPMIQAGQRYRGKNRSEVIRILAIAPHNPSLFLLTIETEDSLTNYVYYEEGSNQLSLSPECILNGYDLIDEEEII
jgi:hypothetical protein